MKDRYVAGLLLALCILLGAWWLHAHCGVAMANRFGLHVRYEDARAIRYYTLQWRRLDWPGLETPLCLPQLRQAWVIDKGDIDRRVEALIDRMREQTHRTVR